MENNPIQNFLQECEDVHLDLRRSIYLIIELRKRSAIIEEEIRLVKEDLFKSRNHQNKCETDEEKLVFIKKAQYVRDLYEKLQALDQECVDISERNLTLAIKSGIQTEKKCQEMVSGTGDMAIMHSKEKIEDFERRANKLMLFQSTLQNTFNRNETEKGKTPASTNQLQDQGAPQIRPQTNEIASNTNNQYPTQDKVQIKSAKTNKTCSKPSPQDRLNRSNGKLKSYDQAKQQHAQALSQYYMSQTSGSANEAGSNCNTQGRDSYIKPEDDDIIMDEEDANQSFKILSTSSQNKDSVAYSNKNSQYCSGKQINDNYKEYEYVKDSSQDDFKTIKSGGNTASQHSHDAPKINSNAYQKVSYIEMQHK
ncbi:UNKNOWN [Stylonychia lemnae]|uniref:Uncharacterized protein n=1 Tax=Stylonychia lemnae TaxID=5949 RepID=A0A078B1N1_STYLE|nr:UNKNOWN [Stylonychia lemnae]|eukprot:CDW87193.1 UNKNOWN [Stylonychia lemnae]